MPEEYADMIGTKKPRAALGPKTDEDPQVRDVSTIIFLSSVTLTSFLLGLFLPPEERK